MGRNLYDGVRVVDLTNNFAGPMSSALFHMDDFRTIICQKGA